MIKRILIPVLGLATAVATLLPMPAQAAPVASLPTGSLPTFGKGPVEVRLYTDYFCGPCRGEEYELMPILAQLVDLNKVRVTFVDYPGHKDSSLYAVYFLAALNAKDGGDVHLALHLRSALFEAADAKVAGASGLERFLGQKGIPFRPLDYRPAFSTFERWITEDKVLETPSCTVISARGRQTVSGKSRILKMLQDIAQK